MSSLPSRITNWIGGKECPAESGEWFGKVKPADGQQLCEVARSTAVDVRAAVTSAKAAQAEWARATPVRRGEVLFNIVAEMQRQREAIAEIVALETGKSKKEALGETDGAIALAQFYAGEGRRLYGKTMTSGGAGKYPVMWRQPVGVAGLIIAANTPIANVAWKVFPALICGNAVVLKAAEDSPATAWLFGKLAHQAGIGLPTGVLNIVQGTGLEAGAPLVADEDVGVLSFTGSTAVGREIAQVGGRRLARVSLELGGKNPFVVCDDADLLRAAHWAALSAFSNAGQRCAAGSRIIVFESVYESFKQALVAQVAKVTVGTGEADSYGAVINQRSLDRMLRVVTEACAQGARLVCGGHRLQGEAHHKGFFMAPTLVERAPVDSEIGTAELFGPIATLHKVKNLDEALTVANHGHYGLTACIHTKSLDRAMIFTQGVQAGMAVVNAATYGSEPHWPFGGFRSSGNGTREPGVEALEIYSQWKNVVLTADPAYV